MKKVYQIVFVVLLLALTGGGCKAKENQGDRQTEFLRIEWADTLFTTAPGNIFTVGDSGELFVTENYGVIDRYAADGTLLHTYEDCGDIAALCFAENKLFFYTREDELKCLSLKDGKLITVTEGLWFTEVTKLAFAGKYVYAYGRTNESGQEEVVVKRIDPKDGSVEQVESEAKICAIYGASDGVLYYCTEAPGETVLYSYQGKTGESTKLYDLTNRPESESPLRAFIYENGLFLYSGSANSMVAMSLKEEKAKVVPMKGILTVGRDLIFSAGNVVYQTFSQETMSMYRELLYLEDVVLEPMEDAFSEFITVWDLYTNELDGKRIMGDSGIQTRYIVGDMDGGEALLTELMAGNPEMDVYVLWMSQKEAQAMKEKGIFVSLNDSDVINEYRDACFPYIAEGMTTDDGKIWMLPIGANTSGIWYVPENLEQFQIQTERFATMEEFTALSKEMKEKLKGSEYYAFAVPMHILGGWQDQYDRVYCDLAKGVVNYETEEFKKFFETLWSGWTVYGPNPDHPYFTSWLSIDFDGLLQNRPNYHPEQTVYKYDVIGEHLKYGDFNGWRVLPEPVISEEIQENDVSIIGLVINPYSAKKELAMKYLETIAKNPLGIYGRDYRSTTSFLFEDMERYEGFYDTSLPAVRDVYELFKTGRVTDVAYPYYFTIVDDYQTGRLSLDEAVSELQRQTEMWLNE